ncbi:MAG: sigma-70 family RNA polymerase sigma factor [Phycisphaerae bacterium]
MITRTSKSSRISGLLHPPPYIMNAELRRVSAEETLFADWTDPPVWDSPRLSPREEVLRFKQLHYCAYKLSRLYLRAIKSFRPSLQREYARWVARYHTIRQRLVDANLGLVYDLIGRSRFRNLDRDEMGSEGMMALLRSVDTFDPWRGFRFSTYACNAILRAFSRAALRDSRRRSLMSTPFDPEFEKVDLPNSHREERQMLFAERINDILRTNEAELTDVERMVLSKRFPPEGADDRLTLDHIGREMHVSKERVRQIQISALTKLRRAVEHDLFLSE